MFDIVIRVLRDKRLVEAARFRIDGSKWSTVHDDGGYILHVLESRPIPWGSKTFSVKSGVPFFIRLPLVFRGTTFSAVYDAGAGKSILPEVDKNGVVKLMLLSKNNDSNISKSIISAVRDYQKRFTGRNACLVEKAGYWRHADGSLWTHENPNDPSSKIIPYRPPQNVAQASPSDVTEADGSTEVSQPSGVKSQDGDRAESAQSDTKSDSGKADSSPRLGSTIKSDSPEIEDASKRTAEAAASLENGSYKYEGVSAGDLSASPSFKVEIGGRTYFAKPAVPWFDRANSAVRTSATYYRNNMDFDALSVAKREALASDIDKLFGLGVVPGTSVAMSEAPKQMIDEFYQMRGKKAIQHSGAPKSDKEAAERKRESEALESAKQEAISGGKVETSIQEGVSGSPLGDLQMMAYLLKNTVDDVVERRNRGDATDDDVRAARKKHIEATQKLENALTSESAQRMAAFDVLVASSDRHLNNVILDDSGGKQKLHGIDNAFCFPKKPTSFMTKRHSFVSTPYAALAQGFGTSGVSPRIHDSVRKAVTSIDRDKYSKTLDDYGLDSDSKEYAMQRLDAFQKVLSEKPKAKWSDLHEALGKEMVVESEFWWKDYAG